MNGPSDNRRASEMLPILYDVLRELAESHLRREYRGHTLSPTELVHEAYIKLKRDPRLTFTSRTQFLGFASRAMRHFLIDYSRVRNARKRGRNLTRVTFDEAMAVTEDGEAGIIEISEAIDRLTGLDPDSGSVVELRFFGGMTEVEVAEYLDRSERWVRDQWAFGRAWLRRELR